MDHFSHEHPLTLIQSEKKIRRKYRKNIRCNGCEKLCTFPLYACTECSFYLHKSCAELSEEFQNPFHPHPLTLVFDADISFACQACFKECNGIHFCCEVCDIDLDVYCALLRPTVEEGSKQLQHFTHFHPLALVEKEDIEVTSRVKCLVCGEYCLGPCYGCDPCGVFLHQSCAEFEYPAEIRHDSHPCPLALHTRVHSFCCRACDTCMLSICYHCEMCSFYIDVECALLTSIKSQDHRQIKHFSHRHSLFLEKLDDGDQVNCFACGKNCSGRPIYVCSQCKFALHESCASVSPKIHDLLHPQHPLTLVVTTAGEYTTQGFRCNVCCDSCNDLTYRCGPCNFNLHKQCARQLPTIKYEGHRHLLLYVDIEATGLEVKCDACDGGLEACDGHCDSSLLRCPQCDFNLHLRCSPLPYTIKHNCHVDSLILKESPAEDELDSLIFKEFPVEDASYEELYCNACEKKRELRHPIYYCPDCLFVAGVSCVISEVARWLKGEYGDVDLKTPGGKIAGKVISKRQEVEKICKTEAEIKHSFHFLPSLPKIFWNICLKEEAQAIKVEARPAVTSGHRSKCCTADDQKELELILCTKKLETSSTGDISFDEQDSFDISIYLDKEYKKLLQKVDSSPANDYMEFWEVNEKFVVVRDSLVPESLAPILESLFAKYGDVSVDTSISPRVKMFLFVMLCWTIDSMCKTRVLDISEDLLINWWKYLKALQSAGFKIQFALDHLDIVVHAYIGLQLKEQVTKNRFDLDEEISKKSEEFKKLEKNLEVLKVRRKSISEESVRKLSLTECLLREATKLKWRKAGEGLHLNKLG